MPKFEKLLMAVTRNGQLQPTHFRGWAKARAKLAKKMMYVDPAMTIWLLELADTLEEIYAEVIARYEEEA